MTEKKKEENIHTAILRVMNKVGYVQKRGKMDFGRTKYKYAGEADLIAALRPAMVEAEITFYCHDIKPISMEDFESIKAYNGESITTINHRSLGQYTYRFTHVPSKTFIDVMAIGEGIDTGDKAPYKSATGALKYALRQTFIIETGDDPDKTASESQEGAALLAGSGGIDKEVREEVNQEYFEEVKANLLLFNNKTVQELAEYWKKNAKHIRKLPDEKISELTAVKDRVKKFITDFSQGEENVTTEN